MSRTKRIGRQEQAPSPRPWFSMDSAPKDGSRVELYIPYNSSRFTEAQCTDQGSWDAEASWPYPPNTPENPEIGCWRFDGDDGAFDIQPTKWRPLTRVQEQ